jgi:hypothetical protein
VRTKVLTTTSTGHFENEPGEVPSLILATNEPSIVKKMAMTFSANNGQQQLGSGVQHSHWQCTTWSDRGGA